ncbi:MAG TPA: hypothetical protein VG873_01155 [Burkholderiales bacterium]|nr:hypothetical protein [Burkholderiales bacterium]
MRKWLAALALALPALGLAQDKLSEEMREVSRSILRATDAYSRSDAPAINLDPEIRALDRMLASGGLNPIGMAVAHYWRARAYASINWVRMRKGEGADPALARKALADFDLAIAGGDVPAWQLSRANTQYMAGLVAYNYLDDPKRAFGYWETCAGAGHAGCLNTMATARLTGLGGIAVDLDQAVELNRRVYDTGTDFQCAGALSAFAIAQIVHTGLLTGVTVDEFEWMRRGYQLLDELAARDKDDNPCERAKHETYEYLMRLKRGEDRRELLHAAAARRRANDYAAFAEYLLGNASRESLERAIAAQPLRHVACALHFGTAWHAGLKGDAALRERHLAAMRAIGTPCATELALSSGVR